MVTKLKIQLTTRAFGCPCFSYYQMHSFSVCSGSDPSTLYRHSFSPKEQGNRISREKDCWIMQASFYFYLPLGQVKITNHMPKRSILNWFFKKNGQMTTLSLCLEWAKIPLNMMICLIRDFRLEEHKNKHQGPDSAWTAKNQRVSMAQIKLIWEKNVKN